MFESNEKYTGCSECLCCKPKHVGEYIGIDKFFFYGDIFEIIDIYVKNILSGIRQIWKCLSFFKYNKIIEIIILN